MHNVMCVVKLEKWIIPTIHNTDVEWWVLLPSSSTSHPVPCPSLLCNYQPVVSCSYIIHWSGGHGQGAECLLSPPPRTSLVRVASCALAKYCPRVPPAPAPAHPTASGLSSPDTGPPTAATSHCPHCSAYHWCHCWHTAPAVASVLWWWVYWLLRPA